MAEKKETSVDLDTILVEIGQFGKYQILTILMVSIPVIFAGLASGEYIFTCQALPHRCLVPQCDGENPEYEPTWITNAIPTTSTGSFDQCSRYVPLDNSTTDPSCPVSLFNPDVVQSCDDYVYERTNTVVYDSPPMNENAYFTLWIPQKAPCAFSCFGVPTPLFGVGVCSSAVFQDEARFGLECQEWKRALIGTFRSIGTLLVLPITGYISDRWGRRVALTVNAFNTGFVGLIRSWATSYEVFVFLEFLESTIGTGAYSSCFILATELVGPKYRVIAGASMSTFFAVGQVLLGFIAWALPDWKDLTRAIYAPQLLIFVYFWILFESVRWLMSKGKYSEAERILIKAAKMNGNSISKETLDALNSSAATETKIDPDAPKEPMLFWKVVRSKVILRRICTTPVWWVTNTLIYYGLSINSVGLAGNMYVNYILVAAIEIPGYWTAVLLLDRIGRKMTLMIAYITCAVCCASFPFIPASLHWLSLVLYMAGKFSISVVMTSIYIYTAELFPTQHRHSLLAFSSMIGRLGSITAPLTPALMIYWVPIPSLIFAVMAFISACLMLTTPETLNTKMPDTIEEAEAIGVKNEP